MLNRPNMAVIKAFVREAFDVEYRAVKAAPPTLRKAMLLDLIRKAGKFDESKHPRDDLLADEMLTEMGAES